MNKKSTLVYLIRHAESEANLSPGIISGRTNESPLSKNGIIQCRKLKEKFREEEFDFVVASPALRTIQTMNYSLSDYPSKRILIEYDFQELDQGEWTGKIRKEAYTKESIMKMEKDHWNFKAPGGESQDEVANRTKKALTSIISNNYEKIAIYTHGGVIKYLCTELFGWNKNEAWKIPVDNCSITQLKYDNQRWHLKSFNN